MAQLAWLPGRRINKAMADVHFCGVVVFGHYVPRDYLMSGNCMTCLPPCFCENSLGLSLVPAHLADDVIEARQDRLLRLH